MANIQSKMGTNTKRKKKKFFGTETSFRLNHQILNRKQKNHNML